MLQIDRPKKHMLTGWFIEKEVLMQLPCGYDNYRWLVIGFSGLC